ncbi:MAG: response regulator transcription factor, partial [Acidimicrobiia bacterium]
ADLTFSPMYANDVALDILNHRKERPETTEWKAFAQEQLRVILQSSRYTPDSPSLARFISGRRRYVCRSFPLVVGESDDTRPPLVALLMERHVQPQAALREVGRQFHLSPREYETVLHLTHGLTTKQIAQRMNVSPNTVKQFVRLTMSKMNVTTRSGILGKFFSS